MSRNATAYAQELADMDSLVPSGYNERPEQGENLSLGCYDDREKSAEEAVKVWYVRFSLENRQAAFSGTRLIRTPRYYGQLALSLRKGSCYIFSKLKPLNTGTPLIRTFFMPPSVNVLSRFDCIYF